VFWESSQEASAIAILWLTAASWLKPTRTTYQPRP